MAEPIKLFCIEATLGLSYTVLEGRFVVFQTRHLSL